MKQNHEKIKNIIDYFNRKSIYNQLSMVIFNLLRRTDIPFSLNVGGSSYTDGKKIVVGLPEVFVKKGFTYEEIFSVLKALTGHEAEHIKSSDFCVLKIFLKEVAEYLKEHFQIHEKHGEKIAQHVLNSVEDGRIEKRLCNRKKGYKKHIQFLNATLWKEQPIKKEDELQDFLYSITSYCVTGIFPKDFEEYYANTRMEEELNKIKVMAIKGINESTAQGCANRCMRIIETIAPYLAELLKNKNTQENLDAMPHYIEYTCENPDTNPSENPGIAVSVHFTPEEKNEASQDEEQNKENGNGNSTDVKGEKNEQGTQDESNKTASTGKNNNESIEEDDASKGETSQQETKEESVEKNEDNKGASTEDSSEVESKDSQSDSTTNDSLVENIINSVRKEAMKDAEMALKNAKKEEDKQKNEEKKKAEADKGITKEDLDDIKGAYEDKKYRNSKPELTISPVMKRSRELTEDIKREGKRFRKEVEAIFRNKKVFDSRHRKKGLLDTSTLWKIGTKNYNVFLKKGQPQTTDYVAYMLVDGSGSMTGRVDAQSNKVSCAQKACAVIEEGIKGFIPFKTTSFQSSGKRVVHTTISEFSNDSKYNESWNSYFPADGMNKDGFSIRVAVKELLKRPEKNRLLIVLSDGLPSSYPSEELGRADVKDAVKEARKHGIKVVSICFGSKEHREKTIQVYNDMYQKSVISCDPSNINMELTRVLKREITH
ncbi:hypothetical protein [Bacillus sp. NPDC094106]|uniref:hypothetical protein n=1 Tax=Bacillus sp. NPDC094106 TaxID=3363949 RepID=UPI0037FA2698